MARVERFDLATGAREWIHEARRSVPPTGRVGGRPGPHRRRERAGRRHRARPSTMGRPDGRRTGRLQYAAEPHLVGRRSHDAPTAPGLARALVGRRVDGPERLARTGAVRGDLRGLGGGGDRLYLLAGRQPGWGRDLDALGLLARSPGHPPSPELRPEGARGAAHYTGPRLESGLDGPGISHARTPPPTGAHPRVVVALQPRNGGRKYNLRENLWLSSP